MIYPIGSNVILGLTLTKDGQPIHNQMPFVSLKNILTNKYFDFSLYQWIDTETKAILPEIEPGVYSLIFDQDMAGPEKATYIAIYQNEGEYALYRTEILIFDAIPSDAIIMEGIIPAEREIPERNVLPGMMDKFYKKVYTSSKKLITEYTFKAVYEKYKGRLYLKGYVFDG